MNCCRTEILKCLWDQIFFYKQSYYTGAAGNLFTCLNHEIKAAEW